MERRGRHSNEKKKSLGAPPKVAFRKCFRKAVFLLFCFRRAVFAFLENVFEKPNSRPAYLDSMGCGASSQEVVGTPLDIKRLPQTSPAKELSQHDAFIPQVPVELRGITLAQLRKVWQQIEHRCVRDHWRDKGTQRPLEPQTVNLYHLNEYFIMKETEKSKLSYVEHITGEKPQKPRWFVSHWWGEPVADFIACIEQHAADRGLGEDIPYWVCAYANNQHRLDPMTDPHNSPFRKALDLCEGTVTVLDQEAKCYTRVWCVYEIFTTLSEKKDVRTAYDHQFLYDVYTAYNHQDPKLGQRKAVGLSDPGDDETDTPDIRQQFFPLERAQKSFIVKVKDAEATMVEDKKAIHEAIRKSTKAETPEDGFSKLDDALHSRFALLVGTQLANRGCFDEAEEVLSSALKLMAGGVQAKEVAGKGQDRLRAKALLTLARIKFRQNCGEEAILLADQAHKVCELVKDEKMLAASSIQIARFHESSGAPREQLERAVSMLRNVLQDLKQRPSHSHCAVRAEALGYLAYFLTLAECNFGGSRPEEAERLFEEALRLTSGATDAASRTCRMMVLDKKAMCLLRRPIRDPEATIAELAILATKTNNEYYLALSKLSQAKWAFHNSDDGVGAGIQKFAMRVGFKALAEAMTIASDHGMRWLYQSLRSYFAHYLAKPTAFRLYDEQQQAPKTSLEDILDKYPAYLMASAEGAAAALTLTFACYVDTDKHIGDISIVDGLAWADMCAKLRELAGPLESLPLLRLY